MSMAGAYDTIFPPGRNEEQQAAIQRRFRLESVSEQLFEISS